MSSNRSGAAAATDGGVGGGRDVPFLSLAAARFGFERGTCGKEEGRLWIPEACLACPSSPCMSSPAPGIGGCRGSGRRDDLHAQGSSRVSMSAELRQGTAGAGAGRREASSQAGTGGAEFSFALVHWSLLLDLQFEGPTYRVTRVAPTSKSNGNFFAKKEVQRQEETCLRWVKKIKVSLPRFLFHVAQASVARKATARPACHTDRPSMEAWIQGALQEWRKTPRADTYADGQKSVPSA
jgi:hypothetical protein